MAETTKDNFILHESVQRPLKELEDLNAQIKKKKQEVKKAMFFAKHPGLKVAKEELEVKIAESATAKFNESLSEEPKRPVKEPIREEPQVPVRKLVKDPAPEPKIEIKAEPAQVLDEPAPKPVAPAPNPVAPSTIRIPYGGKWF